MKKKTIYIIIVVCCFSLFSSAKQSGKEICPRKACCKAATSEATEVVDKSVEKKEYDLSPMHLFLFSI